MPVDLEFWDERAELALNYIALGQSPVVPESGDIVDVPNQDGGSVTPVNITGRRFYYHLNGELSRVRLVCKTL